jgi:hypothetical protein
MLLPLSFVIVDLCISGRLPDYYIILPAFLLSSRTMSEAYSDQVRYLSSESEIQSLVTLIFGRSQIF